MSRGYGVQQRRILNALESKAREQFRDAVERARAGTFDPDFDDELRRVIDEAGIVRARWRWYTIELLGLTDRETPRGERVSLHRAIKNLGEMGSLEVRESMPYSRAFARSGLDGADLARLNLRWPHRPGRALWFRTAPPWDTAAVERRGWLPDDCPHDDGVYVLDFSHIDPPDWFADFCGAVDREHRWTTPTGALVAWLFGGTIPPVNGI